MSALRVGDTCVIERRFRFLSLREPPQHRWEKVVVKITPKRAYLDGGDWFALDDAEREVKPRYLDYRQNVVAVKPAKVNP